MPTISFVVPALNEEQHIEATVQEVCSSVDNLFGDYEILLMDDRSTDRTGSLMEAMASGDPHICVVHNETNLGLGKTYKRGLTLARMEHVMLIPGDHAFKAEDLRRIFDAVGKADMVIPYNLRMRSRPWFRQIVSQTYTTIINLVFGLKVPYYNGCGVHRTDLLRQITITSDGFAFQAEAIVRLLKRGHSYIAVGYYGQNREEKHSKAINLRNIRDVAIALLGLIWDVHRSNLDRSPEKPASQTKAAADEQR